MHERDLLRQQLGEEHVVVIVQHPEHSEDLLAPWVPPPAPFDDVARHHPGDARPRGILHEHQALGLERAQDAVDVL